MTAGRCGGTAAHAHAKPCVALPSWRVRQWASGRCGGGGSSSSSSRDAAGKVRLATAACDYALIGTFWAYPVANQSRCAAGGRPVFLMCLIWGPYNGLGLGRLCQRLVKCCTGGTTCVTKKGWAPAAAVLPT